jgi:KDO2-lipid IV(A) lauroyltransferase
MVFWLFCIAAWLTARTPVRISYTLARGAGALAYYAWAGGRTRCIANMRHVTGGNEQTARHYARRSFGNYAAYLVDFLRFTSLNPYQLRSRVVFDGWDTLQEHRRGNGIVFVTMHCGNWDLGAAGLVLHGFPTVVIADRFGDERLNERVLGARRHLGMEIIPADRVGPSMIRALRRNDVLAALIDIPTTPGPGAVTAEFFGAPVSVPDGVARLALHAGAEVVAATVTRIERWGERVQPHARHIPFTPSGDMTHDTQALTEAILHALEDLVRADPDQWYIFRNLWPADRPSPAHA